MIKPEIKAEILKRLNNSEKEHSIKILYACESGSRAWGFESPDSDFDVRFIYSRNIDWYLSFDVEIKRDVIEYPIIDEIDCGGWDIRKALYLFTRTNGALFEWLHSPIIYLENGNSAKQLRLLAKQVFNKKALCYHYSHMARSNARGYIYNNQVKLKKYFYILRPLLAIRFIEKTSLIPPIEFQTLVDAVAPNNLKAIIADLIYLKKFTPEKAYGKPINEINTFIESEFNKHDKGFSGQGRPDIVDSAKTRIILNNIFRESINS